jgi:tetratricopeptide (TPR) repeat protein
MSKLVACSYATIRSALLVFTVLQLAGCGSPEERARAYYEHGTKLLSENDRTKAAIELRNAVRLKKDMIEAWKALAEIDEINRNWPGVIMDLRMIVELAPNDVSARLRLGKLLLLAGASAEALGLANAGIELDNGNADLHALKAAISFKMDNRADAAREAQRALELDSANVDALMVLAIDRLGNGDAKGALSLLESSSVAGSKDVENNLGLQLLKVRLFGQAGDLKSVEAVLQNLVQLNPQELGYRKLLVNFFVEHDRISDAEKEMRDLAAANPTDPAGALDLVRFLYSVKKSPDAARQELDARIRAGGEIFQFQLALAEMDLAEGNRTDGKRLLEQLVSTGNSPEKLRTATIALARMYLGNRDFDPAETLVTDILRSDAHDVPALKIRASIRIERAQLDGAVADLLNALNYQPRSTELMSLLATAYERSGLIELADKQFADATRASGFDANVGLDYVAFLQRRGSIARAEEILVGLNTRQPNNIKILSTLAQVRLARQNWIGAQEVAQSIRRIGDNAGAADQILGAALIGRNKFDEAIATLQNACDAAPGAGAPMNALVGALLKANRKDQALDFLKSVLVKDPRNPNALVLLGSIQLANGAADQASKSFLAAVEAQPKDAVAYQALADLYASQKNYDEAIKVVQTGLQQQPDATPLQMILAGVLERKGDYEAAISQYELMLTKQPGNLIVANNLASLLLDRRTDEASVKRAQALAVILRKSQIPQFKDTLGWASYHQGDYRGAVSLSEEAAAALPDQAVIRYHLGMGYIAVGQPGKASEQLRKALELAQNDTLAEQIRAALKKTGS